MEIEDEELQAADHMGDHVEPKISLYALTRWTYPPTMRVAAIIGSQHVMVLINRGPTHNFLGEKIARLL